MPLNTMPPSVALGRGAGFGVGSLGCWSDSLDKQKTKKTSGIAGDFETREVSISY